MERSSTLRHGTIRPPLRLAEPPVDPRERVEELVRRLHEQEAARATSRDEERSHAWLDALRSAEERAQRLADEVEQARGELGGVRVALVEPHIASGARAIARPLLGTPRPRLRPPRLGPDPAGRPPRHDGLGGGPRLRAAGHVRHADVHRARHRHGAATVRRAEPLPRTAGRNPARDAVHAGGRVPVELPRRRRARSSLSRTAAGARRHPGLRAAALVGLPLRPARRRKPCGVARAARAARRVRAAACHLGVGSISPWRALRELLPAEPGDRDAVADPAGARA